MSDFKSLPVYFLFHFRPVSCLTSGPYVWSSLCFSQVPYTECRFNLVLYGVQESPEGTNLYDHATKDLKDSAIIFSKILPSITDQAIRDCVRIGKYSPAKT